MHDVIADIDQIEPEWLTRVLQEGSVLTHGQVVAVRSFEDLARLAERDGQIILRHAANGLERFIVRQADVTYQYSAAMEPSR